MGMIRGMLLRCAHRLLSMPRSKSSFCRPGHVVPVVAARPPAAVGRQASYAGRVIGQILISFHLLSLFHRD
jgi:hypothetical protein